MLEKSNLPCFTWEELQENRSVLVSRMAEGYTPLKNILNNCLDKDIPTFACCAGHKLGDSPYITMVYNSKTAPTLNAVLNSLSGINGIDVAFFTTGYTDNPMALTIYTNLLNRDKVFGIIDYSIEHDQKSCTLNEKDENVLRMAIDIDSFNYTVVVVRRKRLLDSYIIQLLDPSYIMDPNIIDENIVGRKNQRPYIVYHSKEELKDAVERLEDRYVHLGYDTRATVLLSAPIDEKLSIMDEYNKKLIKKTGTATRNKI